jgi:hypothetical protein
MEDRIHLQHLNSSHYLASATEQVSGWFGSGQYFATPLGDAGRVTLVLQGTGDGVTGDGTAVQLRTTEEADTSGGFDSLWVLEKAV